MNAKRRLASLEADLADTGIAPGDELQGVTNRTRALLGLVAVTLEVPVPPKTPIWPG